MQSNTYPIAQVYSLIDPHQAGSQRAIEHDVVDLSCRKPPLLNIAFEIIVSGHIIWSYDRFGQRLYYLLVL